MQPHLMLRRRDYHEENIFIYWLYGIYNFVSYYSFYVTCSKFYLAWCRDNLYHILYCSHFLFYNSCISCICKILGQYLIFHIYWYWVQEITTQQSLKTCAISYTTSGYAYKYYNEVYTLLINELNIFSNFLDSISKKPNHFD